MIGIFSNFATEFSSGLLYMYVCVGVGVCACVCVCVSSGAESLQESGYHNLIGDAFVELRGWGICLSPADLQLIDGWQEEGLPVHIPLNVIADIQERLQGSTGKSAVRIRHLTYIQEEVEARFAELLEGHVGCGGCEQPYCARKTAA